MVYGLWFVAVMLAAAECSSYAADWSGWPNWRGPRCDGSGIDVGGRMAESFEEATHLWTNDERVPGTYEHDARSGGNRLKSRVPAGYASPVVVDGRVYLAYYVPNGPVYDKGVTARVVPNGGWGRESWYTDADDVILCVDANTGKTLWKRVFAEEAWNLEAGFNKGGCQLTPCVAYGKVYAIGPGADIYCCDAKTGETVWKSDLGIRARYQNDLKQGSREIGAIWGGRNDFGGCVIPAGNVIAVSDHWEYKLGPRTMAKGNGLIGFDPDTGRRLWYVPGAGGNGMLGSTPMRWTHRGKEYFLAYGVAGALCIDPKDGKVLWQSAELRFSNAGAVDENHIYCEGPKGLSCYKIDLEGPTKKWELGQGMGFTSPCLYKGHLYALLDKTGIVCINVESGKIVAKAEQQGGAFSLALADGRLCMSASNRGKSGMSVLIADPKNLKKIGVWPVSFANSTSPAMADGKVFIRGRDRLLCYDLRVK